MTGWLLLNNRATLSYQDEALKNLSFICPAGYWYSSVESSSTLRR
ncbi:hypothetical protein T11_6011 [Trichinella zimbabwensis]|uniref:Uncharacterized protein n=1 Tax=Trichinella zimbabwensis TaxID=268475 RepID=A0A0V1GDL1_9BILA|nr:hypothetical protein T11_4903 [Trichinella zimbabwensis]KRY97348.1 hypothetical protein T11_6011 [Trichinella zimbabwensis]